MEYKLIKGNQTTFEKLLNELPKGGVIVSFTCSNDASYFAALVQLTDAVLEREIARKKAETKEAIAEVKAEEAKKAKELKENLAFLKAEKEAKINAKKAELEQQLEALK